MGIFFLILFLVGFNLAVYLRFEIISKKLNFFDKPDGDLKKHSKPISLMGGSILLLNLYLIIFFSKILNLENILFNDRFLFIFILLITCFYVIGFIDDLIKITPNKKLFFIIFTVLFTIYFFPEIKLDLIKISFLNKYYYFNSLFSVFFMVLAFALLVNALNMFDGLNLQLILFTNVVFILFISKGFIPLFFALSLICLIMLGVLNYQNRVYLGDSGSYLVSAILGFTFIYQYKTYDNFFFGDEVFIIFLIPAIDMFRLFFVRIVRGKHPFKGDLNHIHHVVNNFTKNNNITLIITIGLCIIPLILLFFRLPTYIILFVSCIIYFTIISYLRFKN
tara:strand:- start:2265 stop:3269 length:1005 start_codon:yes stop_codon:yes gene_type:complete